MSLVTDDVVRCRPSRELLAAPIVGGVVCGLLFIVGLLPDDPMIFAREGVS